MESANKKFDVKFEGDKLELGLDMNQDGEKLLKAKINLSEAVQEAFKKGAAVEGVKSATVSFSGTKLIVKVDTDKDGEALMDLELNLMEALDEAGVMK